MPEPTIPSTRPLESAEPTISYPSSEAPIRRPLVPSHEAVSRRNSCPDVFGARVPEGVDGDPSPDDAESLGLIRDPTGRQHYIGPSGSLQFLSQLRRLLISRNQRLPVNNDNSPTASKFTEDDTARALEADSITVDTTDPVVAAADHGGVAGDVVAAQDELSPGSISSSIARDFTMQPWDAAGDLFRKLPSRLVTDSLLQSYFKNAHEDFPLFHRGTFEEEYESYWALLKQRITAPEPCLQASQMEWGWVATLQMLIVFGSMCDPSIPGIDHTTLRRQCVSVTRSLLPQLVSKCTLSNVRALLLLSLFLHNNNERNAAWNLVGTATRISFALGLHRRDVAAYFRPIEREVRKRVFCTLYSFEQFLASSLGRPSGLNDFDVEIALPREGLLGTGTDRVVALSLKLQNILGRARISQAVRSLASGNTDTQRHEESAKETISALKAWRDEVAASQSLNIPSISEPDDAFKEDDAPVTMSFTEIKLLLSWQDRTRLRAALVLNMQYRYIAIMVARPFLLRDTAMARVVARTDNKNTTNDTPRSDAHSRLASVCVQNACQLAKIVLLLAEFELLNGVCGMDVFYAYSASMVLILRSIKEGTPSPGIAETKAQSELRQLIQSIRLVVSKVPKSGTMKRFARVMATFEDSVFNHDALPHAATPRKDSGTQLHATGQDIPAIHHLGSTDPLLLAPQPATTSAFLDPSFPMMAGWPQGDWSTFGADDGREFGGWIASLLQPAMDTPMVTEFGDMDSILRNAPM